MTSVTVRLHGLLSRHGSEYKMHVDSPAEAIRGLSAQIKGFKSDLEKSNWRVLRDDQDIDESGVTLCFGGREHATIDILPVLSGGKSGAGKIIGGAALITAAYFTGGLAAGASGLLATAAHAGVAIGVSMMLSGTSQLLTKSQKTNSSDSSTNYNFSGPVNTSGQGTAIPKPIGLRVLAGSVVASAEITTE